MAAVLGCGGLATYLLTLNRSPPPELASIRGVPHVVPIILFLLVVGTHVLDRTRYGRHLHAVGNNRDAAHRAGVNVTMVAAAGVDELSRRRSTAQHGGERRTSRSASGHCATAFPGAKPETRGGCGRVDHDTTRGSAAR
ncbi:ABC transporter permease subunit [Saccharopolyspora sp. NPDC000995]